MDNGLLSKIQVELSAGARWKTPAGALNNMREVKVKNFFCSFFDHFHFPDFFPNVYIFIFNGLARNFFLKNHATLSPSLIMHT